MVIKINKQAPGFFIKINKWYKFIDLLNLAAITMTSSRILYFITWLNLIIVIIDNYKFSVNKNEKKKWMSK